MKRRIVAVAVTLFCVFLVGAQPALAAGRTMESVPAHSQLPITETCGFTPTVTQRDPRTLTTWTDRRGAVVLQTLRTSTTTEYAGGSGGTMQLDENWLVSLTPNRDGTSTIVFVGRGAIWGTDTSLGQSFFQWVTGVVVMRGSYDVKTGVFLVSLKRILGQATDMCDSLTTGLKPRH
jgi:hypothetical protein